MILQLHAILLSHYYYFFFLENQQILTCNDFQSYEASSPFSSVHCYSLDLGEPVTGEQQFRW